ncbi:hypothetical protein CU254_41660 (plasmid) [Amycolatopsis sp. AA4]|nr:hypothetical protein CU254_41660 [Amycolatopsis sp. AA4]
MNANPAQRVGHREALRLTLRDVWYLVPAAVAFWAVTGATASSAMWAAGWFALVTAVCFGFNSQYVRLMNRLRSTTAPKRQPRLRARKIAGMAARTGHQSTACAAETTPRSEPS